jgi:hypothetical protein
MLSTAVTVARSYTLKVGAGPNSITPVKVKVTSWVTWGAAV